MANYPTPESDDQPLGDLISADELAALAGQGEPSADPEQSEKLGDLISPEELAAISGLSAPAASRSPAPAPAPKIEPPPVASKTDGASTFEPIEPEGVETPAENSISLLMDVPLRVSIELGRVVMTVQQVLGLGRGSIVELDRLAGEPVDILVNDKPIGRGEVVVIDENFGVKITELFESKG